MLRLGDTLSKKIEKMVEAKQVPYAVLCRMLIAERINEIEAACQAGGKHIDGTHDQEMIPNVQ